ncbi:MAG TPA: hypothetical protein VFQ19_01145 [Nocardioidaceae bacterium]|nr:hypothetical protein [Nocardioidaceae bacterium]
MTDQHTSASSGTGSTDPSEESVRKRRLAKVFGDVLPDGTADDRPESWGDPCSGSTDEWYRNEVPPHHG